MSEMSDHCNTSGNLLSYNAFPIHLHIELNTSVSGDELPSVLVFSASMVATE